MTSLEKIKQLRAQILPDTDSDEVLGSMITMAEAMILNRMYPFGYPDGTVVPARYEQTGTIRRMLLPFPAMFLCMQ